MKINRPQESRYKRVQNYDGSSDNQSEQSSSRIAIFDVNKRAENRDKNRCENRYKYRDNRVQESWVIEVKNRLDAKLGSRSVARIADRGSGIAIVEVNNRGREQKSDKKVKVRPIFLFFVVI